MNLDRPITSYPDRLPNELALLQCTSEATPDASVACGPTPRNEDDVLDAPVPAVQPIKDDQINGVSNYLDVLGSYCSLLSDGSIWLISCFIRLRPCSQAARRKATSFASKRSSRRSRVSCFFSRRFSCWRRSSRMVRSNLPVKRRLSSATRSSLPSGQFCGMTIRPTVKSSTHENRGCTNGSPAHRSYGRTSGRMKPARSTTRHAPHGSLH